MGIQLDIPQEAVEALQEVMGEETVHSLALEFLCVEAYSRGMLSVGGVGKVLGLSGVMAAERWLAERGVPRYEMPGDLERSIQEMESRIARDKSA